MAGTGAGALASALHARFSVQDSVLVRCDDGEACPGGYTYEAPRRTPSALAVTSVGTALGLAFGALVPADRWVRVPLGPRVTGVPARRRGTELGVELTW